jgi:hypothetical protein
VGCAAGQNAGAHAAEGCRQRRRGRSDRRPQPLLVMLPIDDLCPSLK